MPGVKEKELLKLQQEGWDSDLIRLRLAHTSAESVLKYLRPIVGRSRVHPHMLPTQKSGRWSTTDPPLVNWSVQCISPGCAAAGWHVAKSTPVCWSLRDIVVPDPGTYFLKWDLDAIEAKLAAAYSGDERDLELFREGFDIHTITCCDMFGLPAPPDLRDPHNAAASQLWRDTVLWGGKDDWRRVGAKTCRYALTYAEDERSIHLARDVEKMAPTKKEREEIALRYLASKPKLRALKKRIWKQVIDTGETRTALGRRRRFFVNTEEREEWYQWERPGHACKEGFNHIFQGQVADMMNLTLIAVKRQWPEARLAYQSHDGAQWVFPDSVKCFPFIRRIVEREWEVAGAKVVSTAGWSVIHDNGQKEELG